MLGRAMEVDAEVRRGFVERECAQDTALKDRVLGLLAAAVRSERFLEKPALEAVARNGAAKGAGQGTVGAIPDAVGEYLVVGVLGAGGMATVYEAIQEEPRRRVALKVMHQWMLSPEAYQRFKFETQALARLSHPGIAQIYEVGAARIGHPAPAPFFAMELVVGAMTMTEYARRHGLGRREKLVMFASVCDAVHHGHQHGIIHRDLKPANILVDDQGRAKVIDFGVARATDGAESPTAMIGAAGLVGTLAYMSPEQCGSAGPGVTSGGAGGNDVDIRSDVYSLGVVLYELICGRVPVDVSGLSIPGALRAITMDAPRPPELGDGRGGRVEDPSARNLTAVMLRALAKEPGRRYDSASALASDVRRVLAHQPVEARPPGLVDQFRLLARRHRALVTAGIVIAASIAVVAGVSTVFAVRLSQEVKRRGEAEVAALHERDEARWKTYTAQIAGALAAMRTGEFLQMRSRLAEANHVGRGWEWGFLARISDPSESTILAHDDMVLDMAVTPDGQRLATIAADGSVRTWEARSLAPIAESPPTGVRGHAIAFWPDGSRVVTGDGAGVVRLLDTDNLGTLAVVCETGSQIRGVAVLQRREGAGGALVCVANQRGDGGMWTAAGLKVGEFPGEQPGGTQGVWVSPDQRFVATSNDAGHVWIRRASDLEAVHRFRFPGTVHQVRISADGRLAAAAGGSARVMVWNLSDGSLAHELQATMGVGTVRSVAFSDDGTMLVAGLVHRGIVVVDLRDGRVMGELGGHAEAVAGLVFQDDDRRLISASWDGTIRTWLTGEITTPAGTHRLEGHQDHVIGIAFSPDGSLLASASTDETLRLWDPVLGEPVAVLRPTNEALYTLAFSPDGRMIAAGGTGEFVALIDADTGTVIDRLGGHGRGAAHVSFDATGRRLAVGCQDGTAHVWDLATRTQELVLEGHSARVNSVRFSPDGTRLGTGSRDGTVRIWDAGSGRELHVCTGHSSDVFAVLFSPDGSCLYSGSRDQSVRVWDVASGRWRATLGGHGQYVTSLAMSADRTRLAAGSWFGQIVLFDVATGDQIATFRAHDSAIRGVAFSPDGRWLASSAYDGSVRLHDSATRDDADAARARTLTARGEASRRIDGLLAGRTLDAQQARTMLDQAEDGVREQMRKEVLMRLNAESERSGGS